MCQRNPAPKLDDSLLAAFMRAAYKQIEGATSRSEKDILANSPEHQETKAYQEAVRKFCETRGDKGFLYRDEVSVGTVIERLEKATMNNELADDIEHLKSLAASFQREIVSLFRLFAIVAHKSLLARDDLGHHIVSRYGRRDEQALEALAEAGEKYAGDKQYHALVELLLTWGKK